MAIDVVNYSLKNEKRIVIKEETNKLDYHLYNMYLSADWVSKVFRHSYKHLKYQQYNDEMMFKIRNTEDIIYITVPVFMQNGKVAISAIFISPDNIPQSYTLIGYKTWNTGRNGSESITPDEAWKINLDTVSNKLADKIEEFKNYEGG